MDQTEAVVAHVTAGDPAAWRRALGNVSNLLADETLETPADTVTVVMHGGAVERLLDAADDGACRSLLDAGVAFAACSNTLDRLGAAPAALEGVATIVPSGVGEVVRRQRAGEAYLRLP